MTSESGIVCIDCGLTAPETESAYTLIGKRHGWRLSWLLDPAGKRQPQWRCDQCFRRFKTERAGK